MRRTVVKSRSRHLLPDGARVVLPHTEAQLGDAGQSVSNALSYLEGGLALGHLVGHCHGILTNMSNNKQSHNVWVATHCRRVSRSCWA